jgi:hypothetical protein
MYRGTARDAASGEAAPPVLLTGAVALVGVPVVVAERERWWGGAEV